MTKYTMETLGAKLSWEGFEYIFDLDIKDLPVEIRADFQACQEHYLDLLDKLLPYMDEGEM